ncbi:MAG TPA: Dam family site-specific DNA-(adenine-N6)-methyltransferase [Tenuifilaceae bacterium]|nr:Dam family site-specific DNA-(adenine-N6)-methyltransferase [Tenuifilaceae bacterium]HOZ14520.1 Dam family site-specific DNA-(adenine-N6)-methyltransferase [Tenuifilaceae bacterium]HPN20956.1 Dam family site-specific DNA-(adenine-N6)-methyltransferase [Tenuifilaceae bacterium]
MTLKKNKIKNDNISRDETLHSSNNTVAHPFLKWAGGKRQLLEKFQELYPTQLKQKKIKTFYEPFLGSGAVFFDIAQKFDIKSAYLYDINEELILTYKVVQKDVSKLLDFLYHYQKDYIKLDKKERQNFFYDQRNSYNLQRFNINYSKYSEHWFPRAAQLIFLNRTCFNGLYRVNSKGEFNSPVGDYVNPVICDEKNLLAVHKVLQIAEIKKADFKQVVTDLNEQSFIYFDPPYRPISKTASFNAYSKHAFDHNEQVELASLFRKLDQQGMLMMLSNSDPKNNDPNDNFFEEIYNGFNITRVPAKRMINSDSNKRGAINEIVVTNY